MRKSYAPSNFAFNSLKENRLSHGKKVSDLLIDDEVSWLKYFEEVDDTKSTRLGNSAAAVAIVARDNTGIVVNDTLADILWDWLHTFESVADGEILGVKFAMIISDAGKDENKNWISS